MDFKIINVNSRATAISCWLIIGLLEPTTNLDLACRLILAINWKCYTYIWVNFYLLNTSRNCQFHLWWTSCGGIFQIISKWVWNSYLRTSSLFFHCTQMNYIFFPIFLANLHHYKQTRVNKLLYLYAIEHRNPNVHIPK